MHISPIYENWSSDAYTTPSSQSAAGEPFLLVVLAFDRDLSPESLIKLMAVFRLQRTVRLTYNKVKASLADWKVSRQVAEADRLLEEQQAWPLPSTD